MCSEAAASTTPACAIEVQNLHFGYGKTPLFQGFDLCIPDGCTTGIIGPNGCGKSTLLKLCCGLLKPHAGNIALAGKPLAGLSHRERAKLAAFMPQESPRASLRVEDLVLSGRFAYQGPLQLPTDEDRRIAREAMDMAGIGQFRDRPATSLSGGQRQRAYIAMALAQQAEILLLDEPTSALDVGASHEIMQLVRMVQSAHGHTAVVVLHDLDLALRYCDHLIVMESGTLVAEGTPSEVVDSGAISRVFDVRVCPHDTPFGRSFSFFTS